MQRPVDATDEEWEYMQLLAHDDAAVRSNGAGGLQALDAECAVPILIDAFEKEPDELVRGSMVYYLGYLCVHGSGAHDENLIAAFDKALKTETSDNVIAELKSEDIITIRERLAT